jgi:hypothetical protein
MKHASFSYQAVNEHSSLPFLSLGLRWGGQKMEAWGLVDSGASINVMPHRIGVQLGLNWNDLPIGPQLGGAVMGETRTASVFVQVQDFDTLPMAFCWLNHDNARLILGHQDFFERFVVCFDTSNQNFSILNKGASS